MRAAVGDGDVPVHRCRGFHSVVGRRQGGDVGVVASARRDPPHRDREQRRLRVHDGGRFVRSSVWPGIGRGEESLADANSPSPSRATTINTRNRAIPPRPDCCCELASPSELGHTTAMRLASHRRLRSRIWPAFVRRPSLREPRHGALAQGRPRGEYRNLAWLGAGRVGEWESRENPPHDLHHTLTGDGGSRTIRTVWLSSALPKFTGPVP